MARLIGVLSVLLLAVWALPARADGPNAVPGLITANNVEITSDTGEVLDQRLQMGDPIFLIQKYKKKRDGWARISRTQGDVEGIGWVEIKFVQSFERWEPMHEEAGPSAAERAGEKTVHVPDVEPARVSRVGVLPFTAPDPDDPIAQWAYDAFSASLKNSGKLQVSVDALRTEKTDPESPASIQSILKRHGLDGVFVGNLSGDMGQSRLLQVKFFGKGREGAVLEKVKKIPKEGNLKEIIDTLAASCVGAVTSK